MNHKSKNIKLQIDFDNNVYLPLLFGEHNVHLAKIESSLDVVLSPRGNKLMILGSASQAKRAHKTLEHLYDLVRSDKTLDLADVTGVLRMTELKGQSEEVIK